jgi:hypothetical protein
MVVSAPWTPEEDELLRALALSGASVAEMAKQINLPTSPTSSSNAATMRRDLVDFRDDLVLVGRTQQRLGKILDALEEASVPELDDWG